MDRLGDMRLFVDAAELGSLSAAGRKLGLSPAAASARLIKLEKSFKTRLFDRTTRQLRLTEEGAEYLQHCRVALQAIEDGEAALQARHNVVRGKVRISATSDFGRNTLQRWLHEFNELHPEVTLSIHLTDSRLNLLNEEIDLAIRFALPQDSGLVAKKLAPNRRVLCASPAYLERKGVPFEPAHLENHTFVLMTNASGAMNEIALSCGQEQWSYSVPLEKAWETNDGALCRDFALAGYGIALKSIWDIADDISAGRLQIVLPAWSTKDSTVHALFHKNRYLAPRVRVLLDFLAQRFEQSTSSVMKTIFDKN